MYSRGDVVNELMTGLLCFLIGGFCGSALLFVRLANEMDKGPKLAWRSSTIFWRFFGDKSLEVTAARAEASRRAVYGCMLIGAMADLSGRSRSPYPTSRAATEGLLAEAERRFQLSLGDERKNNR